MKNKFFKIFSYIFLPSLILCTGLNTQAQSKDEKNGGKIIRNNHVLTDQSGSRAEYRYRSVNEGGTTYVLEGKMKPVNFDGDRVSIIQVLNVKVDGEQSGGANPINQLAIKKDGNGLLRYYIVYGGGNHDCSTTVRPKVGETHKIKVSFRKGGIPKYTITRKRKTITCQKSDDDRAGRIGASDTGKYFYAKLGAYVTNSGTGPAKIKWTRRSGY